MKTKKLLLVFVSVIALVVLCSFAVGADDADYDNLKGKFQLIDNVTDDIVYAIEEYEPETGKVTAITGFMYFDSSLAKLLTVHIYIMYTDSTYDHAYVLNQVCYGRDGELKIHLYADSGKTIDSICSEHCILVSDGREWDANLTIFPT